MANVNRNSNLLKLTAFICFTKYVCVFMFEYYFAFYSVII